MKFSGVRNQAGRFVNPVYVCSSSERSGDACCRATAVLLEDESNEHPGGLSMRKLKIFSGLPHASQIISFTQNHKSSRSLCSLAGIPQKFIGGARTGTPAQLLSLQHSSSSLHPFLSLPPTVALSQQLEPVGGKTLLVVHALWDEVATTSITPDSGVMDAGSSWNPTG